MSVVIDTSRISKRFFFGERGQRAFFEDVAFRTKRRIRRILQRDREPLTNKREFWALQDISFQVSEGQTLSVIGENGAGKSTLLKILSRITQPTTGSVKVYGRLASLLEVGTGFHPEFTGRDNIFLNGAMLGLSNREVRARFDRIVDFSGLEEFLDLPVKNYSSGMYVRLAFSVAAHLNPEIMILDEVLAVGDAVFQQKCLDRMHEIINEGHAAILVSHGLALVRQMSHRCMWLEHGRIKALGPTQEVADLYQKKTTHDVVLQHEAEHHETVQLAEFVGWGMESNLARADHTIVAGYEPITIYVELNLTAAVANGKLTIGITDTQGIMLFSRLMPFEIEQPEKVRVALELQSLPLKPGGYIIVCEVADGIHKPTLIRVMPEMTILADEQADLHYNGLLHLNAQLSVEERVQV